MQNNAEKIQDVFRSYRGKKLLITAHVNPDGDALGASVGLVYIALALSCDVRLLLVSGRPETFEWLFIPCPWVTTIEELKDWAPDLLVIADCGDANRVGEVISAFLLNSTLPALGWEGVTTVNIDHHFGNPEFAKYNWVDPDASSTGELVGLLARGLGLPLSGSLGEAIYLTIVTDTGNFTYSNARPEAFAMAAEIVANGLDVAQFTTQLENQWTLGRMHLWGKMMSELSLHADGAIVCSVVTQQMLIEFGATKDSLEGFASWMRRLKGVRVSVFVREDGPSSTKLSIRSMGDIDVRQVAATFGGGGHKAAAGAEIDLPVHAVKSLVLEALLPLVQKLE